MAVFTGRRTRRQIIDQALKKAGNTKILAEARVELNRILERLYLEQEWPFLYMETTLTLTSSTTLPDAFLKVESKDTGLRVTAIDGLSTDHPIEIVDPTRWRRQALPRDETASIPEFAMIDYATSTLKPWPAPESSVTALLVYKFLPDEVDPTDTTTYDADVPLFPYHGFLTDAVEVWAMEYEHDPRASGALMKLKMTLDRITAIAIPKDANQADELPLDPSRFSTPAYVNEE